MRLFIASFESFLTLHPNIVGKHTQNITMFCGQGALAAAVRAKGLHAASKSTKGLDMIPKIPSLLSFKNGKCCSYD